ncbi:unnamed protein product [Camellia sinensis]
MRVYPTHPWKQQQQEGEAKRSSLLFFTVCPSSLSSSDFQSSNSVKYLLYRMDNYATKKGRKDLIEEVVALQHVVSSINYACAMYIVILHAAFKKKEIRLQLPRSPRPYGKQIDHLNRLVNDSDINCHDQLRMNRHGTYVKVFAPAINKPRYRTRKREITTNVLGVCSQDMQFIYVLPGWEGSASDSRVLRDAVSRPNGLKVPTALPSFYMEGRGCPNNSTRVFNMRHSSARNVIERCFGLLKMRWAILRSYSYFPIKTQFRIITACCLLHNLIQREMPMDLDDDKNEEMNPPPPVTDLEDEMIDVVEASDQWSEWRTALATQMFNEWQASRGMDDTGTTSSRKKGKPRRFWNHRKELFLITTMKDVTASNPRWKPDNNQFRAGFYNECEKKILIDDEQKMVLVDSDDVWQNYVRRVPDAKGMRNRPFPFYKDWLTLFGKDKATGELAEDPADAIAAMEPWKRRMQM